MAKIEAEVAAVIAEGRDMTIATLMPDGAPHASTVSYASRGEVIYFGCSAKSQKAANLARDPRVALTINLPYRDWAEIRGVAFQGRARRLSAGADLEAAALLFMNKFSEIAQFVSASPDELALFEVTPTGVALLDYRKGFGHVEYAGRAPATAA